MSNPLEFIMKLRDAVSAPLAIMNSNGVAAYKRLETAAGAYQRKNDTIPQSIQQIKMRLNELQQTREISISRRQIREADREIDALQQRLNRLDRPGTAGMGGGGMGMMFRNGLAMAGVGGGLALGVGIANFGMEAEKQTASFKVMLGSAERAKEMLQQIRDMGAVTPFTSNDLIQNSQMLLQFGIHADKLLPTLHMLGDASGGNAERMKSLSLAFGQVSSAGKMQGQDLMQMVNAGFNPLSIMAEKIKGQFNGDVTKAYQSLREKMEQGGITAQMVEMAFQSATLKGGTYFNLMNEQSQTTGGRFSTLKDNVQMLGLSIYESIKPALNLFMDLANWLIQNKEIVITLGVAVATYSVITNAAAIATRIYTAGQWLLNAALTANPVGLVIAGIAALAGTFMWAYNKVDWFRGGVLGVWEVMKGLFRFLLNAGSGIGTYLEGLFTFDVDKIKAGALQAAKAWKDLDISGDFDKGYNKGVAEIAAKAKDNSTAIGVAPTDADFLAALGKGKGKGKSSGLSESVNGITGSAGGKNITINLGKFFDSFNINTQTINEGVDHLEAIVEESMMRVLNSVNTAG